MALQDLTPKIDPVEELHPFGKIGEGRLDQEMVVVRHQAVCVADPPAALDHMREDVEIQVPMFVRKEDVLARVPATSDVVDSVLVLDAKRSSHGESV